MKKLKMSEIAKFLESDLVGEDYEISNIVIDSRVVTKDDLFIPIIGEVNDAHKFIPNCYENGCRNFLIGKDKNIDLDDVSYIKVDDTTKALGCIAKKYRERFDIPFIAVTGSVGKTSTKDIIYSVLKEKYNMLKTMGNQNNEIGLPRTLLSLGDENEMGVIEMGMYVKGEIDYLVNLVKPEIAVITNIGMSHIMNFDNGQDGIFEAKMEIVNGLKKDGILIVNGDDKYLKTLRNKEHDYKLITYGFDEDNDIYVTNYTLGEISSFNCIYEGKSYDFEINSMAKHNILNGLVSIVIGLHYGLSYDSIKKGLLNLVFSANRLDIFDTDKYKIINDCYNSSYDSVMSGADVLNNFKTRKVAILGDIRELGDYSESIHRKIGKNIKCDLVVTIGNFAKFISEEALKRGIEAYHFDSKDCFFEKMDSILKEGDTILIKASFAMGFEEIVLKLKDI